jgi:dethiobiotin synthetase
MTALFVAGSHTDIGKTHVACALIRAARGRGLSVEALKPVASGFDAADWAESDPGRLLAALGQPLSHAELVAITPWRFAAPLAPPTAAALENRALPLAPIVDVCRGRLAASAADLMLVEGVGGLMSPLADGATGLDLMLALKLPAVLVGGGYLGAISHTLTALEVMRARGIAVAAVVLSQDADPSAPDLAAAEALTAGHAAPTPVLTTPRSGDPAWADFLLTILRRAWS